MTFLCVAAAPWAIKFFADEAHDYISDEHGKTQASQFKYYRERYLNFGSEEGKLLNCLLSPVDQIGYFSKIGAAYVSQGDFDNSIKCYKSAVSNLEQLRSSIELDRQKITFFTEKLKVYEKLVEMLVATDRAQEAFFYIDRCKSRSMADLIASHMLAKSSDDIALANIKSMVAKNRGLIDQTMITDHQVRSIQVKPVIEAPVLKRMSNLKSIISVELIEHEQLRASEKKFYPNMHPCFTPPSDDFQSKSPRNRMTIPAAFQLQIVQI